MLFFLLLSPVLALPVQNQEDPLELTVGNGIDIYQYIERLLYWYVDIFTLSVSPQTGEPRDFSENTDHSGKIEIN